MAIDVERIRTANRCAECATLREERDLMRADLLAVLDALGLNYAQPISGHEVVRERALPMIAALQRGEAR